MTNKPLLKILFVEDVPSDAELEILVLRKEGLQFEYKRVDTREHFIKALNNFKPDFIISDYSMPEYDGSRALKDTKEFDSLLPFILCTGSINEETAVECLKAGANDYVIKEHMARLPFAVREALEQHRIQLEKKAAELLLRENEEKLQSIFSAAPIGIGLMVNRTFIEVNDTFCKITGYSRKELIGKSSVLIYATKKEYENDGADKYGQISEKGTGSVETRFKCKNGKILNILLSSAPLDKDDLTKGVTFTAMDITQKMLAEEALQESQHLFQTLAQVSPVGIFRTDPDGYTTYVNPKWSELSGLAPEDAEGLKWLNAVHPDDMERLNKNWLSDSKSRRKSTSEYRFLRSDGNIVWVMGNAVPELIGNEIVSYIGTITDITERKRAEEVLRKSEEKYRQIYENVQDVYYETSIDGTILNLSPSIGLMSKGQYHQDDLLGKSMSDFYSDPQARQVFVTALKEKGSVPDFEIILKNRDGSSIPCSISAKILFNAQGLHEKIVGSIRDITRRKQVEELLRESEEKSRSMMENSADAIFITDLKGKYVYTNKAVTEILGYTSEEMKSKSITDITPKNETDKYFKIFQQTINEGKIFTEIELLKKDGNFISTDLNSVLLPGGLVYGSCRDITERKKIEESLKQALIKAKESDSLKTAFLHNISHEIRTPMNAIMGFSTLLGEHGIDAQVQRSYIETIMQSSNHLLSIITDIVDISNIEANIVKIAKNGINVNSALNTICNQFQIQAGEKNIRLVCESDLSDSEVLIITDQTKLTQILTNLLSNAIKFTDEGNVKVSCRIADNFLEFSVSDTGIGIPGEHHSKIFERFYQVKDSMSRLYEGTGLGLAISKAYVSLMGGKIWLSSEPRKGTTFTFTLPYERQTVAPKRVIERPACEGSVPAEKKTILVAEDDDSNYQLIIYFLFSANATLLRAFNGKEAVRIALAEKNIDLILMDIKMPEMDGYEAVRLIREANITIPIIAQTAYFDDTEKALECGCSSLISKPFDKKTLLNAISEFI